jgi:signal transduction histidine kinase
MASRRTIKTAGACGLFAMLAGGLALFGWTADIVWLKSVVPGFIAMNPLTAICFGLAGLSLWLLRQPPTYRSWGLLARGAALAIAVVGGIRLGAYLYDVDFDIDRLMFAASLDDNRMAPNTAVCFLICGMSLLLLDVLTRRGFWPAQILAVVVATISLISLVGYGYGAESMYQIASYVPMALNTAAVFHVLSIGILLSRPERGIVAVLLNDGPGGIMSRRLLPAVVAIPALLGWLRILGQRMGFYDTEFGAAFMVATTIMMFLVAMGWIASALNRSDFERRQTFQDLRRSEQSVRQLNAELEQRVTDRTAELAAANADLLDKNRENELFVYSVSHDLRSPLVNLQGFSKELSAVSQNIRSLFTSASLPQELEQRGLQLVDDDMQRCVRFIQTAVSRLSNIIDALLRLSRAGRIEYQPQRVDIDRTVARIIESMSATIYDRGVSIETRELPPSWGDPTALEQVFANLIGNAVNYIDPHRPGHIEIGSQATSAPNQGAHSWTTYYCKDNGLGIPEAYHGKVFQALKRLHPEAAKGEGMGLAIARRIVERHGGTIRFESSAGLGTTFFVTLPSAKDEPQPYYPDRSSNQERNGAHDNRTVGNLVGGR